MIVERNRGLEYALLVASNSHISTILSHPLWKNVNESKKLCTGSANYHVFQSFEVFFSGKISFFLITCMWRQDLKLKKRSLLFSKEKWWLAAGICLIWKLMEYKNDNSPDVSIITTFYNKFLYLKLQQILNGKNALKLISTSFLREKYTRFFL